MKVVTELQAVTEPCAFTIGMFDGVHLGHQQLLCKLGSYNLPSVVLTFPEHPLRVLGGQAPKLITPLPVKLALLETLGIHTTVVIPFTKQFAETSYSELLSSLPVKQLLFGQGAAFGKGRLGDETAVRAWAKKHHAAVEYIEKTIPVSSTKIREAIASGDLIQAEMLLGHPHLLYVPQHVQQWDVSDLALPEGTYSLAPGLTAHISNGQVQLSKPVHPHIYPLRNTP